MSTPVFDSKNFLASLTKNPGVYRMIDADGAILYVGKARNLKSRVSSYFRASGLQTKTMAMISKVVSVEVTATNSETEALLLEQSLIKSEKPPYNILLRDDKSYPYVFLSSKDDFPRLLLLGLGSIIIFQALLHMGVSVNLIPVTGQTLPLISKGGSSVWVTSLAFGIILNISHQIKNQDTN